MVTVEQDDQSLHDDVDDARADSAEEEVGVKLFRTPGAFEVGAEHREIKQIEKNMQDGGVQENVGEELPDPAVKDRVGR